MTDTKRFFLCVLVKDATVVVFLPRCEVHGISTDQFELPEAVVAVVRAGGAVYDELLACGWVIELLGSLVGGETIVDGSVVGCFFPCVCG